MTNAVSQPGWREAGRINLHDPAEIEYWTKVLDCTRDELIEAVKKVGISAQTVRKQLQMERVV